MSWNKHIEKTTSKANQKLGFIKRNIKVNDQKLKERAYKAIVRPTLEYCSTVWDPYHKTQAQSLEMVQRRAARWVTGRYHNISSVSDMLRDLGWRDLAQRRADNRLNMLYKITKGIVNIPIASYITIHRNGIHIIPIIARTQYTTINSLFSHALSRIGTRFPELHFRPKP